MVKPYLNQIGGKVENDVGMFTGGLNTYTDKAFIEADQMPYVMNMTMTNPPMLRTRGSRRSLHERFSSGVDNSLTVMNIYVNNKNDFFLITRFGISTFTTYLERYYILDGESTFRKQVIGEIPTYDNYYFAYCPVVAEKYLYIANEFFKIRINLNATPGNPLVIDTYNDHFGIPVWHKSKLWLCKPTSNTIEWSNSLQPDNFITGQSGFAGELYVTRAKGVIKSIVSFDDKLIVMCEHSIHAVYGDSGDPSNVNFFQLVDLNNNLGIMSANCVAIGGERLFFLGDNLEVYEYTGSSLSIVSRPGTTRNSTISVGGVSGLLEPRDIGEFSETVDFYGSRSFFAATSERLYINTWNMKRAMPEKLLFVFDIYNRVWWCEDGSFTTIAAYSSAENSVLLAKSDGDVLVGGIHGDGNDYLYDRDTQNVETVPIQYEFHTRVYGADGLDMLKTLSEVWVQARANADVYITDIWESIDKWAINVMTEDNGVKIGTLKYEYQAPTQDTRYRQDTYEQQVCHVPKMYGERLNTFQIVTKGEGQGKFWLMKRVWRAR